MVKKTSNPWSAVGETRIFVGARHASLRQGFSRNPVVLTFLYLFYRYFYVAILKSHIALLLYVIAFLRDKFRFANINFVDGMTYLRRFLLPPQRIVSLGRRPARGVSLFVLPFVWIRYSDTDPPFTSSPISRCVHRSLVYLVRFRLPVANDQSLQRSSLLYTLSKCC